MITDSAPGQSIVEDKFANVEKFDDLRVKVEGAGRISQTMNAFALGSFRGDKIWLMRISILRAVGTLTQIVKQP